jgi:hypothetical protein
MNTTNLRYFLFSAGNNADTCDIYIDNIAASWLDQGEFDVQDAPAAYFHVGAEVKCFLCPTTNTGTDYQLTGDHVIREIQWTKDDAAILKLGFAGSVARSKEEILFDVVRRHSHDSTL